MTGPKHFLQLVTLPSRLRDWIFNIVISALCGARIRIVWSQVKIQGAGNIRVGQRFTAGRGL